MSFCNQRFNYCTIIGADIGFDTATYIDYQDDDQIFNGRVKWYDYLGVTVLGVAIVAGLCAFASMSLSATLSIGLYSLKL